MCNDLGLPCGKDWKKSDAWKIFLAGQVFAYGQIESKCGLKIDRINNQQD